MVSRNDSSTGLVVTENTDLSSIPQAQLCHLNQLLLDESRIKDSQRPLVSDVESIDTLRDEYQNSPGHFMTQIDWLQIQGFRSMRRTRGDGDCFYRSTAFAFVEQVLQSDDKELAVCRALSVLESTRSLLDKVKIERLVSDLFYDAFTGLISNIVQPDDTNHILDASKLLERFQIPEESNSVVAYLRMVTSAQIRQTPEEFREFLLDPDTAEMLLPDAFCERFVDPFGKEADHVQITALCRALKLDIDVAYLDGRLLRLDDVVDFVPIRSGNECPTLLRLLYRPGHYDILIKDRVS